MWQKPDRDAVVDADSIPIEATIKWLDGTDPDVVHSTVKITAANENATSDYGITFPTGSGHAASGVDGAFEFFKVVGTLQVEKPTAVGLPQRSFYFLTIRYKNIYDEQYVSQLRVKVVD